MGIFEEQTVAKPVVPRCDWDPWGRSNYLQVINFGKTGVEIRRDQGGSTRNKTSIMKRS